MEANLISNGGRGSKDAYFLELEREQVERLRREDGRAAELQRGFVRNHIRRNHRSRAGSHLRYPTDGFQGPLHFARQVAVSSRLGPAEAVRGHAAVLLCCGRPPELPRAEEALRDLFWSLDSVHPLPLPIQSWEEALDDSRETASPLQRYVMREIGQREPRLVAILDCGRAQPGPETRRIDAVIVMFRRWGLTAPLAALRVRPDSDHEWPAARRALWEGTLHSGREPNSGGIA